MKEGWLRRRYMWYFRRKEVLKATKKRTGACIRCGKCCSYCIFHDPKGKACRIYRWRPDICRNFPLTPEDVRDAPTCGYGFNK
jgi:Fe-S-cluster containining protein